MRRAHEATADMSPTAAAEEAGPNRRDRGGRCRAVEVLVVLS